MNADYLTGRNNVIWLEGSGICKFVRLIRRSWNWKWYNRYKLCGSIKGWRNLDFWLLANYLIFKQVVHLKTFNLVHLYHTKYKLRLNYIGHPVNSFFETVAVYCENHMEHTNTLCGQNEEFSSYLTGNTTRLRYKAQPVNVVYRNNRCLLWESHKIHKYIVCKNCRVLNTRTGGTYGYHCAL
jgi:hypothetical protein